MKVIIAGGRDFTDYEYLKKTCDVILYGIKSVVIVSGKANGADKLGEKYAHEKQHVVKSFPAFWDVYGKSAGYKRNEQMAHYADCLIAFWDGQSRGTKHMIDIAKTKGMSVYVIPYPKSNKTAV